MIYCIDTCFYSRMRRGDKALQAFMEQATVLIVPVIVVGELLAGFEMGNRMMENESLLSAFLLSPGIQVQEIDQKIARRYGNLVKLLRNAGTPIPTNDIWIASTAIELSARLITYDQHYCCVPGLNTDAP